MLSLPMPSERRSLAQRIFGSIALRSKPYNLVRVLIEGGNQGDWHDFTIDRDEYILPQNVTTFKIGSYGLDLVARVNSDGILEPVVPSTDLQPLQVPLPLKYFGAFRPRMAITEDGRIYFDGALQQSTANGRLLHDFLDSLKAEYGLRVSKDHFYREESKKLLTAG